MYDKLDLLLTAPRTAFVDALSPRTDSVGSTPMT